VSESSTGRAAATHGMLSVVRFQEELRRGVPPPAPAAYPNPLNDALQSIERNPAFAQSRVLTRLLSALVSQAGEFRSAEVFAFDSKTRTMVVALLDAFVSGIPGRDEWQRAIDSALAAQRGAQGRK
jgi:hypothetical protein